MKKHWNYVRNGRFFCAFCNTTWQGRVLPPPPSALEKYYFKTRRENLLGKTPLSSTPRPGNFDYERGEWVRVYADNDVTAGVNEDENQGDDENTETAETAQNTETAETAQTRATAATQVLLDTIENVRQTVENLKERVEALEKARIGSGSEQSWQIH